MEKKQSGGFSGSLGFVFAAAGSAVGVGNIWQFPYLAARDGYFVDFITSPVGSIAFMLLFLAVTAVVVYCGVEKGIEKFSSIVMPLISQLTCVFIGWVLNPRWIAEEMELGGCRFGRKKLYGVMIRYIAPVIMAVLFVQSMGLLS